MKRLDLNDVVASFEGESMGIEPGAYACIIQAVEDVPEREYLVVTVGVSEGPRKGFFDQPAFAARPWAHQLTMSYKQTALGMLKGRLERISGCNPGFDAVAAVSAGQEQMLVGRKCCVVFVQSEYYDAAKREFRLGAARPDGLCSREDYESGKFANPRPKLLDTDEKKRAAMRRKGCSEREISEVLDAAAADAATRAAQGGQAQDVYDDVPF